MTTERKTTSIRYDEGGLAAHALNLIGDRWSLLGVRELMFAPKRFQMIRAGMPGITASVLTARLAQLRRAAVIDHDERLGIYTLTDAGRGLLPVLESLCHWALTMPGHDPTRFISPSALMVSMGANLLRDQASELEAMGGFVFEGVAFEMKLQNGRLQTTAVPATKKTSLRSGKRNPKGAEGYGRAHHRGQSA